MREFDVTLVWSPRSNLALYGQTVDIAGALEEGVRVALSTDWSPSGSFTMREEVTCARRVAQEAGVALSSELLWRMATGNGAYALGLEDRFGAIEPGLSADLILVKYAGGDPYEAVLTATDEDVLATRIDGRAILLSASLNQELSASECVTLDGVAPRVCGVLGAFGLSPERFDRSNRGGRAGERRQRTSLLHPGAMSASFSTWRAGVAELQGDPVYSCPWSRSSTCTSRGSLRACTWPPPKRFQGSLRKAGR